MSLTLIFLVLYSRYRSTALSLMILANVPLALIGSVIALQFATPVGRVVGPDGRWAAGVCNAVFAEVHAATDAGGAPVITERRACITRPPPPTKHPCSRPRQTS